MESIKTELRRTMRVRRAALDAASTSLAGRRVVEQLTSFAPYVASSVVVAYSSVGNEVPTGALIADARARGKSVFLPRAEDGWFFAWEDEAALVAGGTGVGEPPAFTPLPLAGVAGVAFVPLLAWDVDGGRLGRGGGWYDRVLPRLMMPIVGVAYDFQERARVPTEPWDVRLDYVVTESRLLHCGKVPSGRRLS